MGNLRKRWNDLQSSFPGLKVDELESRAEKEELSMNVRRETPHSKTGTRKNISGGEETCESSWKSIERSVSDGLNIKVPKKLWVRCLGRGIQA